MSALTFETLSTELTQALAGQSDTPTNTTARCTLGRDKVMVLVEYPLNSEQSEPSSSETLDWLEQQLRHQFDTVGLPEAAADLAESGSEIPVQLFLKHLSELKPFTMRSFIWKVDDGFDDLFGSAIGSANSEGLAAGFAQRQSAIAQAGHSAVDSSQIGRAGAVTGTVPRLEKDSREIFFHSADESVSADENADESDDADIRTAGISAIKTGVLPENMAAEQPAFAAERSDLLADFEDEDEEDIVPLELGGEDLQLDLENDLAPDLVSEPAYEPVSDLEEQSMLLTLPGEPPEFESEAFNLPAVELSGAMTAEMHPAHADFFTVEGDRDTPSEPSDIDLADIDLEAAFPTEQSELRDTETIAPKPSVEDSESNSADLDGNDGFDTSFEASDDIEPIAFELIEPLTIAPQPITAETISDDADFSEDELQDDVEDSDEDTSLYKDEPYEDELYENESDGGEFYEDDPVYYLEGEGGGGPTEEVAAVDEREVQRQREQWDQQSQNNSWIFAGALGFVVVGVLGFVLTRPCTFGSCDRLQTAQQTSEEALSSLRLDSSLAAVTDAKQQLKRSVGLLAPIPIWSPYYREAQSALPGYERQVRSLNYVTSAQEKAYQAALASQDPPHPVSQWQQIAKDWRSASEMLEAVPAESPVRELADSKLTEYRANRATILVRIDAEAKAEVGLRQAQQAASIGTEQVKAAGSLEDWEAALASWESAVDNLSQIPQGTNAHGDAQELLPEYLKTLEDVRANTEQERSASRSLFQAKQMAAEAQKAETEEQWSTAIESWQAASRQLQDIQPGTLAHAEAEALKGLYATSFSEADNNFQVALRFQPVEPNFFAVCGMAGTQKCTYSVRGGNVRLDLFQGYDAVIDKSITPPDQRAIEASAPQLVGQSNQLLQEITLLSTQAQVPVELYDAQGEFLARYRPDLSGFTR